VNCDQNPNLQQNLPPVYHNVPCGNADAPANGLTNQYGAINFGGWALSHIARVGIYRNPIGSEGSNFNGWVWIQDAVFIAGARPDIANTYPAYPNNNWGWGTQILSNRLPDSNGGTGHGNGTYTFHTVAFDTYGYWTNIGDATIGVNNAASVKPFGTLDTPAEGGTASGQHYVNFGWALTPLPKIIYTNAQWIFVYVDNVLMPGNPVYNLSRCDIDIIFPNLRNSGSIDCMANGTSPGPVGFYTLDTTTLSNGLHTISWAVYDSDVVGEGLGSRYFYVSSQYFTLHAPASQTVTKGTSLSNVPVTYSAMNGFNSPVTLSAPSWPAGLSATFTPNPVTGQAMMTITSASNTLPGRYSLSLAGVSGALSDSTSFSVTVNGSGGSAINVDSTNGVSNSSCVRDGVPCTPSFRWEPSSAAGSGWLTSWHDLGNMVPFGNPNSPTSTRDVKSFTSYWNGAWSAPLEHRTHSTDSQFDNHALGDSYLHWDTFRSQYELVALDFNTVCNSVWLHSSNDSMGASWNDIVLIPPLTCQGVPFLTWDFPSMAVDSNTGRIVVGASQLTGVTPTQNTGYYTAYSTDAGTTWNGPYLVNGSPTGGDTSRIVWSASGFHVFIRDCSDPMNCLMTHWQSPDGQTWTQQQPVGGTGATYVMPLKNSPNAFTCGSAGCGPLNYASTADAVSSPGLGWVVAFPVNIGGSNAINVATELGGGNTINIPGVDLFSAGIATSSRGDYYLTYQMFQAGAPGRIEEAVVYREPGPQPPTFKGLIIQMNIDPSQWQAFNLAKLCTSAPCYASGDFFRPAMNQYTGATVPMIVEPSLMGDSQNLRINDFVQSFIDDPPGVSEFLPRIEPYIVGTSMTSRGVMTPTHLKQVALGMHRFSVSTMVYESLRRSGVIK